ncbi:PilX N-terminal domain-containing pilus assembly protein [Pseudomonas sp. NPDC087358]|uniref:pilus assembly PilX family protein n=1 Tax=Pseudomonas sp. NPDC087358 TaxID=3364439 RepID=UPI00384C7433
MKAQRGVVLIVSLVFLVLLTLLATSSMQNATLQEKVAGSLKLRNASFQIAEAVLRAGEAKVLTPGFSLPQCPSPASCLPPPDAKTLSGAAGAGASGMTWEASDGGFYAIQYLGQTDDPAGLPEKGDQEHRLYRVTAIAVQGTLRTVLESIHTQERRIMWRQRL